MLALSQGIDRRRIPSRPDMTRLEKARHRIAHLLAIIRRQRRNVVIHGNNPNVARPATSKPIVWVGSVEPAHALDRDVWEKVG